MNKLLLFATVYFLSFYQLHSQDFVNLLELDKSNVNIEENKSEYRKSLAGIQYISQTRLSHINSTIETDEFGLITMSLNRGDHFSPNFIVRDDIGNSLDMGQKASFYSGHLEKHPKSLVYLTIVDDEIALTVIVDDENRYILEKNNDSYNLVYHEGVEVPSADLVCSTTSAGNIGGFSGQANGLRSSVGLGNYGVYLEVDFLTYISHSADVIATSAAIGNLFGQVAGLFNSLDGSGRSIGLELDEIFVYTSFDGYATADRPDLRISQFSDNLNSGQSTNTSEIAQLVHWSVHEDELNGLATAVGNVCSGNGESVAALGSLNNPIIARNQMAHEMAHCLGASHTQCCINGFSIESDGCGATCTTPAACDQNNNPPLFLTPSVIMSYCWANAVPVIPINMVAPFHPTVVDEMEIYTCQSCPPSSDDPCPGDRDCDGIPDSNECEDWISIDNGSSFTYIEITEDCPEDQVVSYVVDRCNDSNPCTINDRIQEGPGGECFCAGDLLELDLDDINSANCEDNSGVCLNTAGLYSFNGSDGIEIFGAISSYPVSWNGAQFITTPDLIDGMARVVKRQQATGEGTHEGIVIPLCCPIKNDGKVHTLTMDLAFLPYYNNNTGTLLIQGSENVPNLGNSLPASCITTNDYICLGEFQLNDNLNENYPRVNNNNTCFEDFWLNQVLDYDIQQGQTFQFTYNDVVPCGSSDLRELNYLYLSLDVRQGTTDETQNPLTCNVGPEVVTGGGSLLMNNIVITYSEPPIMLERIISDFSCLNQNEVTTIEAVDTECNFSVCEDDMFRLEVVGLDNRPFCLRDPVDYLWEQIDNDGCVIRELRDGKILCIDDFSSEDQGRYRITVFDQTCDCSNEKVIKVMLTEPVSISCDLLVKSKEDVVSTLFEGETDCELLICQQDYKELTFQFGDGLTVYYFQDENFDPTDFLQFVECGQLFDSSIIPIPDACYTGTSTIDLNNGLFGTYLIVDNNCGINYKVFRILEDDRPEVNTVEILLDCFPNNTHQICLRYNGQFFNNHTTVQFSIDGGMNWSDDLMGMEEICYNGLPSDNYTVMIRWGNDDISCCEFVDALDLQIGTFQVTGTTKDALCDHNNGTILMSEESYTYNWSNGMVGHFIQCLSAGTYTVTISDGGTCNPFSTQEFIISAISKDVINQDGGNSALADEVDELVRGIKLPAGTNLTWCFKTYWISDRLIIEVADDENYSTNLETYDTGPVSSFSNSCCMDVEIFGIPGTDDESYCQCSNLFLGDYTNGDVVSIVGGSASVIINGANCTTSNQLSGVISLTEEKWVRILVDNQLCNEEGDYTLWEVIATCGESGDPCVAGDSNFSGNISSRSRTTLKEEIEKSESKVYAKTFDIIQGRNNYYIYPNPTSDELNISRRGNSYIRNIKLLQIDGQLLKEWDINNNTDTSFQLNVGLYNEGLYLLEVINESNESEVYKIVLQN